MWKRKIILLIGTGLCLGVFGANYFAKSSSRGPASVVTNKSNLWAPTPLGKHLALFKVEIASTNIPESDNDETTLTGRILVNQEFNSELEYAWGLPEDVQVIEGNTSDILVGVQKGQLIELKLTVTGFSKEKQKLISLQASGKKGAEVLGTSAMLASRPEDTWEAVAPNMKKDADEQLGTGKSRRGQAE
ncbi:MAG: hypothetical protein HUU57_04130 [Bdellovibrio sp.]|nr:hypothetical protein [Bdellovibrio sp.]